MRAIGNVTFGIDLQGQANLVDGCTALNNGTGIRTFEGSLIVNSSQGGGGKDTWVLAGGGS